MRHLIYTIVTRLRNWFEWHIRIPELKSQFGACGKHVDLGKKAEFYGTENIYIGNNVSIGEGSIFLSTRADIHIGNNVMLAPHVTIVTGDHRVDLVGRTMKSVTDGEKKKENDQPVIIEGDNWIGANAIILKGVTIGEGAVVGAGAVVTRSVEPYSCVAGVPAKKMFMRFTAEEINEHKQLLKEREQDDNPD